MADLIPSTHLDLFQKRSLGHLVTLMPDGCPQVTPVWVDYDGINILINTAKGRLKERNMRQRARVALDIIDPDDVYRWLSIRGRVIEITTEDADNQIDRLYQRYMGIETYPYRSSSEIRVICKIQPEHVVTWQGEVSIPGGSENIQNK